MRTAIIVLGGLAAVPFFAQFPLWNFLRVIHIQNQQAQSIESPGDYQHGCQHRPHTSTNASSVTSTNHPQCVSAHSDLKNLIASAKQIVLLMPAKAAGSSLKQLVKQCNEPSHSDLPDNFFGAIGLKGEDFSGRYSRILTNSVAMPPVLASHLRSSAEPLKWLIRNMPRSNLIIYVHREEQSRLRSAIKHAIVARATKKEKHHFEKIDGYNFFLKEENIVSLIKKKYGEIGPGTYDYLTCDTYKAIDEYAPKMAFVDYRSVDTIQKLIAEKNCPAKKLVKTNVASQIKEKAFVLVNNATSKGVDEMPLDLWLDHKMSSIEWALGLNNGASCVARTREMEDEMVSRCNGGFFMAHPVVS